MIGRLQGEIIEKQPPLLLVDVAGVGYEVLAPMSTFYALPEVGSVVLHTHFSVSENAQQLYGFAQKQDRTLFRELIKVSGVGPKMALAILSGMEVNEAVTALRNNNVTALTKIPGVGKKTAERLVIEMRDRLKDWSLPDTFSNIEAGTGDSDILAEAESAMIALGYKPNDAAKAIAKASKDQAFTSSQDLIRLALRSMLPG